MSDKVDEWVKKDPSSWAKLVETNQKQMNFDTFKKKFKLSAIEKGKRNAVKQMTNQQIMQIYNASGLSPQAKTKSSVTRPYAKAYETKTITVKTKNKTYTRTVQPRWEKTTTLALTIAAKQQPRTETYDKYVKSIMQTTGRTRQAVVKKIQRIRKTVN